MLVFLEIVARLRVAVAIAIVHIASFLALAFHGEVELVGSILLVRSASPALHHVLQVIQAVSEPCIVVADSSIVICRCTVSIQLRAIAILDDYLVAVLQAVDGTGVQIESHLEVLARNIGTLRSLIQLILHRLATLCNGSDRRSGNISTLHSQLLFHLNIALGSPRHVLAQQELDGNEVLALWVQTRIVVRQGVDDLLTWTHDVLGSLQWLILLHAYAVLIERPDDLIVFQRLEVILVEDFNLSLLHVDGLDAHVLVNLLHLVVLSLRGKVWAHDSVHAEHAVVWLVVFSEVAAVGPVGLSCGRILLVQRLVNPVPDGSTHKEVGAFDSVPVIYQVTAGVAHGMRILRDVERILQIILALNGSLHPGDGRILIGTHIHDVVVAFILHRATGIVGLDGIVAIYEVLSRTRLVTQAPDNHRRMVDCGVNHLHVSGDVGIAELRNVR